MSMESWIGVSRGWRSAVRAAAGRPHVATTPASEAFHVACTDGTVATID